MSRPRLKGAYPGCSWCGGNGCIQCDAEREKAMERRRQPILTVTYEEMNDPSLGPLIRDAIGREALEHAFGLDGGGVAEIEENCAIVSLLQAMRGATLQSEEPIPAEASCDVDSSENAE